MSAAVLQSYHNIEIDEPVRMDMNDEKDDNVEEVDGEKGVTVSSHEISRESFIAAETIAGIKKITGDLLPLRSLNQAHKCFSKGSIREQGKYFLLCCSDSYFQT